MSVRISETLALALGAALITAIIVCLILLIFLISDQEQLLVEMLRNTVKGDLFGVAFTAGGPFGMWVITILILYQIKKRVPLKSIQIFLSFESESQKPLPSCSSHFQSARCSYSILSEGQRIGSDKVVPIQIDQYAGPFIYVRSSEIENPEYEIKLEYRGHEWFSDSYSPKKGRVNLQ